MQKQIDFSALMQATEINANGTVVVNETMSALESNPKDDWLYLGLLAIKHELETKKISSFAVVGSGNGIDVVAALHVSRNLKKIIVTDILPDILPLIKSDIENNADVAGVNIEYVAGRDAEPLRSKVDLIYGNLPLIMVADENRFDSNRATTTITEASSYMHLSKGENDELRRWSLLSQLGFLLSAKEKLNPSGTIITLIGGRIPYPIISECFERAGLKFKELFCAFKRQSDPEFLKDYSEYEKREDVEFCFYDYEKAAAILKSQLSVEVPDIIKGKTGEELKTMLKAAQINAVQAYDLAMQNKFVGHLAHAFEATLP